MGAAEVRAQWPCALAFRFVSDHDLALRDRLQGVHEAGQPDPAAPAPPSEEPLALERHEQVAAPAPPRREREAEAAPAIEVRLTLAVVLLGVPRNSIVRAAPEVGVVDVVPIAAVGLSLAQQVRVYVPDAVEHRRARKQRVRILDDPSATPGREGFTQPLRASFAAPGVAGDGKVHRV